MLVFLATQSNTFIIGDVAKLLGWIMNAIFNIIDSLFGVQNIGLSIILFTIVIYTLMLPLTYKQQKFSKMSQKMNPELMAIRKKYEKKQDQASMMAMNDETRAVYEKYGVSASGSCLQLLIQMPIIFALYQVVENIPAYISGVKNVFMPLVNQLLTVNGGSAYMADLASQLRLSSKLDFTQANAMVDALNKFQPKHWADLADKFPQISELIYETEAEFSQMNSFLGINIANSPSSLLKTGAIIAIVVAVAIPVLAAVTQWLNVKLMPQPDAGQDDQKKDDSVMAQSMKQVNMIMPLMSAIFCFTLPVGIGLYWIMSSVVRSVQQLFLNRHFNKIDLDEVIKKNLEKVNEKRAKQGLPPARINEKARQTAQKSEESAEKTAARRQATQEAIKKSTAYYNENAKPGSIASKANMVKKFDEKNGKK